MKRAAFISGVAAATVFGGSQARAAGPLIRIGTTAAESFCLPLVAYELGLYTKAGLNVEMHLFNNGAGNTTAVAGHAVDVACTNTGTFCNTHPRNIPFTVIAPGALYQSERATSLMVVSNSSAFKSAKDFVGKTVAVATIHESAQAAVMRWLDVGGGDSSATNYVELLSPEMDAGLVSGRVDGALLQEPFLSQASSDVRSLGKPFDAIAPVFLNTAYFADAGWLADNTASAKQVVAVLKQAAIWANHNDAAIVPILSKYSKIPEDKIAKVIRARHGETLQPTLIQPVVDVMARYKFSPARFDAKELVWIPKG